MVRLLCVQALFLHLAATLQMSGAGDARRVFLSADLLSAQETLQNCTRASAWSGSTPHYRRGSNPASAHARGNVAIMCANQHRS